MPTILNLGVPGTTPGIAQVKNAHKYIVTFQGIGGIADSQALTRNVISVTKPGASFNPVEQHRYNSTAYSAGKLTWEPIDMIVEDTIDNGATLIIQQQMNKQLTSISGGSVPLGLNAAVNAGDYKFSLQLLQTVGNGSDGGEPTVIERWTLQGCWFTNVTYGDNSWEDDSGLQISCNIQYDWAIQDLDNSGIDATSALVGE